MRLRCLAVALCSALLVQGVALHGASLAAEPGAAPEPEPPPAATPPPPPPAVPSAPDPGDDVLRRILRSGCRDGLPEARALAASGSASWAATVSRLCGELVATRRAAPAAVARERDGRAAIVIGSSIYGVWLGTAADVLFDNNSVRFAILPPLAGMGAGLGLSLLATAHHPIDNGQSWTIITGYDYGSINGALWAGGLDLSTKSVVGAALATGLSASAVGLLVADKLHPRQGDVEVVRSGLLWGTVTGLLVMAAAKVESSQSVLRGAGVAMDLGFLAGLGLAASFDVSRNRDLIIDASAAGGAFLGFGVTWLLVADPDMSGRALAGGTLAGLYAGMAAAIYLTSDMDRTDDDTSSGVAALFGRDTRGRWTWGTPAATPVLDGTGRRVVGATLSALGGTF
jgi:hypothetical protein